MMRDTGREEAVYNLRVAEWATYFVGDPGWGADVWAHNTYDFISGIKAGEVLASKFAARNVVTEAMKHDIALKVRTQNSTRKEFGYGGVGAIDGLVWVLGKVFETPPEGMKRPFANVR